MFKFRHLERANGDWADGTAVTNPSIFLLLLCLIGLTTGCGTALHSASSPANRTADLAGQLRISIQSGPASVGVAYNAVTSVSGGSAPYTFSISSGSLPPGLVLNSSTGSITGTPSIAGTYNFGISASSTSPSSRNDYALNPIIHTPGSPRTESGSNSAQIDVAGASEPRLSISPNSATITSKAQEQFSAHISGSPNTGVTWSASVGQFPAADLLEGANVGDAFLRNVAWQKWMLISIGYPPYQPKFLQSTY